MRLLSRRILEEENSSKNSERGEKSLFSPFETISAVFKD